MEPMNPSESSLSETDRLALEFLQTHGPHAMGPVIETEEDLAAAVVFNGLRTRGLALCQIGDAETRGPVYAISPTGKAALA